MRLEISFSGLTQGGLGRLCLSLGSQSMACFFLAAAVSSKRSAWAWASAASFSLMANCSFVLGGKLALRQCGGAFLLKERK